MTDIEKFHPLKSEQHSESFSRLLSEVNKTPVAMSNSMGIDTYFSLLPYLEKLRESDSYTSASVQFSFDDISKLSEEELIEIKRRFQQVVTDVLGASGSDEIHRLIDPDNPHNIIDHELAHFLALPNFARQHGCIFLTFLTEGHGITDMAGLTYINPEYDSSTHRQKALIAVAPRSLSSGDEEEALLHAALTQDEDFLEFIEGEIARKNI